MQAFLMELGFKKKKEEKIFLDCSNGIGGSHIQPFVDALKPFYNIELFNTGNLEHLNHECGAEYVHKEHLYPNHMVEALEKENINNVRCVAFDGDADRIVYFLPVEGFKTMELLDGDRYICLFAIFFQKILKDL